MRQFRAQMDWMMQQTGMSPFWPGDIIVRGFGRGHFPVPG